MAELYSIIYVYHNFFIHSPVDRHLGCFCVLAIVNSAAVNTGVQVSFWIVVFSGYMPSSGITGSHERYSIFLGRKNQYCENDCTTKCNLQIQCDPYQIANSIFTKLEQKISQFTWKHKRPQRAKTIFRKKRNKPMHVSAPYFWQWKQEYRKGKGKPLQ